MEGTAECPRCGGTVQTNGWQGTCQRCGTIVVDDTDDWDDADILCGDSEDD